MSLKLKFALGVLLLAAGFSVYKIGAYIVGEAPSDGQVLGLQEQPSNGAVASCSDSDSDGLCDNEEFLYGGDPFQSDTDGDGFLDGEEVVSGFNAEEGNKEKEKKQKEDSTNITSAYLDTLFSTMLGNNPEELNLAAITEKDNSNFISLAVLDGISEHLATPVPTPIFDHDAGLEEKKEYLKEVAHLMNLIPVQDKYFDVEKFTTTREQQKMIRTWVALERLFKNIGAKFNAVHVPKEFVDWHEKTSQTLARSASLYKGLSSMPEDPLLSLSVMEIVPDIMLNLIDSGDNLNHILESYNINATVHPYTEGPQ